MATLKASADRVQTSGKIRDAYRIYARLIDQSQGSSDEKVVEVARQAKVERDKLLPQVKAQIDREEAEQKRKEEVARQLVALKAQQAAEAKARMEAEQQRKAKEARLAQFTVNLKGGAWVIKGGGQSDILRGLNIYIIKRDVLKADLNEVLAEIQKDPDFSKMGDYIRDLPSKPDDNAVSVEQLYKAIRFADLSESNNIKMIKFQYDTVWPRIVKKALVAEAITNIDGKYEVKDLRGGHYLLYAHDITRFWPSSG